MMRIWSRAWWKCCDTSAVRLRPSSLHASRRVDPGDLATTIKFDYKRLLNACQLWLRTWWQSLSSLSMGTVNQYTLITWLDPMGTKTSSINQRLHLPGSCASPSVRHRWRREGTICANMCVCYVGGSVHTVGYREESNVSQIQSNEHNSDLIFPVDSRSFEATVSHWLLPRHHAKSHSLNSYFIYRFVSELSVFLYAHCLVSFSCSVSSFAFVSSSSSYSYSDSTTIPRSHGASLHYCFPHSVFHK